MQVPIFCATCKKPFLNPANLIKHLESQGLYCLVESINSPELSPLNSSIRSMPKEDSKEDPKEYSKEDPKEGLKEDPKDPKEDPKKGPTGDPKEGSEEDNKENPRENDNSGKSQILAKTVSKKRLQHWYRFSLGL